MLFEECARRPLLEDDDICSQFHGAEDKHDEESVGARSRRCRRTLEGPQKRTARANECRRQRTAKATPVAYSHGPPRIVAYEKTNRRWK